MVALAILALVTSLVAPRLLPPRTASVDAVGEVIARARRMAVEGGRPLTLSVEDTGDWYVASSLRRDVAILRGHLDSPQRAAQLDLLPTGACIPHAGPDWDSARCTPFDHPAK